MKHLTDVWNNFEGLTKIHNVAIKNYKFIV